jgi:hypothetical protein
MRKFALALLADDTPIEAEVPAASDEVVAEIAQDPAGDIAAAGETAAVAESSVDTIDSAEADAEALDQVADLVDTANQEGGLDPIAAESIKILTNRIRANLGMEPITGIAVENFKSKHTRVKAGTLAKESIQSTAKAIWDYIVKLWDKLVAWLKKWYNNFFDGVTKLKNRADKVVKAAENKEGDKFTSAEDKKLVGKSYAENLTWHKPGAFDAVKPTVATGAQILEAWIELEDEDEGATSADMADDVLASAKTLIEKVADANGFKTEAKGIYEEFKKAGKGAPLKGSNFDVESGFEVKSFHEYGIGTKHVFIKYPKGMEGDLAAAVGKMRLFVAGDTRMGTVTKLDMEAVEPDTVKKIAEKVRATAEMMLRNRAKLEKVAKSVATFLDSVKRTAGQHKDEAAERAHSVRGVATAVHSFVTGGVVAGNQIVISLGHATLTYCADSLEAVAKAEEEKPEDDDSLTDKKKRRAAAAAAAAAAKP